MQSEPFPDSHHDFLVNSPSGQPFNTFQNGNGRCDDHWVSEPFRGARDPADAAPTVSTKDSMPAPIRDDGRISPDEMTGASSAQDMETTPTVLPSISRGVVSFQSMPNGMSAKQLTGPSVITIRRGLDSYPISSASTVPVINRISVPPLPHIGYDASCLEDRLFPLLPGTVCRRWPP